MLKASQVCDICHHLLIVPKSSTVILCKAIDIDQFVKTLLDRNQNLIYDKTTRTIKNRENSAKVRFFTGANLVDTKGIKCENAFYVCDLDSDRLESCIHNFKNTFCFNPVEE